MKKLITALFFAIVSLANAQIISQYIETNSGTTPKGIEIFNNTLATLDFSANNLVIEQGTNGGAPAVKYTLSSGTLAIGDVIVIGTGDLETTTTGNGAAFYGYTFVFNGDDALVVKFGGTITDVFGNPNSDPGTEWSGNGVSTANQNIRIKAGIFSGDLDGWIDPSVRFETVNTNPSGIGGDEGFGNPAPLPVELTTFSANVIEKAVNLNWETATEVNNYGFNVERKPEAGEWSKVAFVEGHGNSNSPKYYSYSDKSLTTSGKYLYRLKQVDIDGTFEYSDAVEVNFGAPEDFVLNQNYPNPFNPTTSIQFTIPLDSRVRLSVFNVLGEEVAELVNQNFAAGYHSVDFNGSKLNSGIYFYKLEANNFMQIRKMMLVK